MKSNYKHNMRIEQYTKELKKMQRYQSPLDHYPKDK